MLFVARRDRIIDTIAETPCSLFGKDEAFNYYLFRLNYSILIGFFTYVD